jgi:uncharacterized protein (TIGR03067 family)
MGAGDNQTDSGQGELKTLQGIWTVVSFEANSEKAPEEVAKKMKLTVKDNNWVLERGRTSTRVRSTEPVAPES